MTSATAVLISISLMGSIAAGFVMLIRAVFGKRISAGSMLFIWIPVILRFLIPYIHSSETSVYNYVPTDIKIYSPAMLEIPDSAKAYAGGNFDIALIVWMCGAVVCACVYGISYFRFRKSLINSDSKTDFLNEKIEKVKKMCKIKRDIKVLVCKNKISPMIIGFLKPVLLIPEAIIENFNQNQLEFVIVHELTHVKRKDRFLNLCLLIMCCVHWFNPFVRMISSVIKKDNESACDESVVRLMSAEEKYLYSKTLIDLAELFCARGNAFYTLAMANGKKTLKARIRRIYSAGKKRLSIIALPVCVITCTLLLTGAVSTDATKTAQKIAEKIQENPIPFSMSDTEKQPENEFEENTDSSDEEIASTVKSESEPTHPDNTKQTPASDEPEPETPSFETQSDIQSGKLPSQETNQNPESAQKTYTYQNSNTVAALSNDPSKSGFAHNSENLRIETVAVLSANDENFRGYFNIYKDGVLTGENVRATVSASPSAITFNDERSSENDFSFSVQTKTIS